VFTRSDGNSFYSKNDNLKNTIERKVIGNDILNISELATLWHLPSDKIKTATIAWGTSVLSEAPENLPNALSATDEDKQTINFFGKTIYKNKDVIFGIRDEDRRRHLWVIGKTGTGKTVVSKYVTSQILKVAKEKNLNMKGCYDMFIQFEGIGKFLSYQIMLDAMYDGVLSYSENDWSFAFLGCSRGLKHVFPDLDMNDDVECLGAMRWLHEHQREYLEPLNFKSLGAYPLANGLVYDGTTISLSNIENCLCEFSKYMKTKLGQGRPRVLYKPKSSELHENHTLLSF